MDTFALPAFLSRVLHPAEEPATVPEPAEALPILPMPAESAQDAALRQQEEVTLLAAIKKGDEAAFAALYQRWAAAFSALSIRMLSDVRDAEEAVQEGFAHLWRKAQTYNAERSSPFTWAYMIFRSKALDRLRARERFLRATEEVQAELATAEPAESPAAAQLRAEEHAEVHVALGGIAKDQRVAIEMAFFAGLTHGEIAQRLNVPLGTIKARIRRGLEQLGQLLSRTR